MCSMYINSDLFIHQLVNCETIHFLTTHGNQFLTTYKFPSSFSSISTICNQNTENNSKAATMERPSECCQQWREKNVFKYFNYGHDFLIPTLDIPRLYEDPQLIPIIRSVMWGYSAIYSRHLQRYGKLSIFLKIS